jgi:hypothetical protein
MRLMRLMRTLPPPRRWRPMDLPRKARVTREIVPACSAAAGTVRAEQAAEKLCFLKGTGFEPVRRSNKNHWAF